MHHPAKSCKEPACLPPGAKRFMQTFARDAKVILVAGKVLFYKKQRAPV